MKKFIDLRIDDLYYLKKEIESVSSANSHYIAREFISTLNRNVDVISFSINPLYDIVYKSENASNFLEEMNISSRNFDSSDIIEIIDSIDQARNICYLGLGFCNSFRIYDYNKVKNMLENNNYEVNINNSIVTVRKKDITRKLLM